MRLVIFDFDSTLAALPVHEVLAARVAGPPTEAGLLQELREAWDDDDSMKEIFGGALRLAQLRACLERICGNPHQPCVVMAATEGWRSVARTCLAHAGLLTHFVEILGNPSGYKPLPTAPGTVASPRAFHTPQHATRSVDGRFAQLRSFRQRYGMPPADCLLVHGDLWSLSPFPAAGYAALWVWRDVGMTAFEMDRVARWAQRLSGCPDEFSAAKTLEVPTVLRDATGSYMSVQDATSVEEAAALCNAVDAIRSHPVGIRIVPFTSDATVRAAVDGGCAAHTALYRSPEDLLDLAAMMDHLVATWRSVQGDAVLQDTLTATAQLARMIAAEYAREEAAGAVETLTSPTLAAPGDARDGEGAIVSPLPERRYQLTMSPEPRGPGGDADVDENPLGEAAAATVTASRAMSPPPLGTAGVVVPELFVPMSPPPPPPPLAAEPHADPNTTRTIDAEHAHAAAEIEAVAAASPGIPAPAPILLSPSIPSAAFIAPPFVGDEHLRQTRNLSPARPVDAAGPRQTRDVSPARPVEVDALPLTLSPRPAPLVHRPIPRRPVRIPGPKAQPPFAGVDAGEMPAAPAASTSPALNLASAVVRGGTAAAAAPTDAFLLPPPLSPSHAAPDAAPITLHDASTFLPGAGILDAPIQLEAVAAAGPTPAAAVDAAAPPPPPIPAYARDLDVYATAAAAVADAAATTTSTAPHAAPSVFTSTPAGAHAAGAGASASAVGALALGFTALPTATAVPPVTMIPEVHTGVPVSTVDAAAATAADVSTEAHAPIDVHPYAHAPYTAGTHADAVQVASAVAGAVQDAYHVGAGADALRHGTEGTPVSIPPALGIAGVPAVPAFAATTEVDAAAAALRTLQTCAMRGGAVGGAIAHSAGVGYPPPPPESDAASSQALPPFVAGAAVAATAAGGIDGTSVRTPSPPREASRTQPVSPAWHTPPVQALLERTRECLAGADPLGMPEAVRQLQAEMRIADADATLAIVESNLGTGAPLPMTLRSYCKRACETGGVAAAGAPPCPEGMTCDRIHERAHLDAHTHPCPIEFEKGACHLHGVAVHDTFYTHAGAPAGGVRVSGGAGEVLRGIGAGLAAAGSILSKRGGVGDAAAAAVPGTPPGAGREAGASAVGTPPPVLAPATPTGACISSGPDIYAYPSATTAEVPTPLRLPRGGSRGRQSCAACTPRRGSVRRGGSVAASPSGRGGGGVVLSPRSPRLQHGCGGLYAASTRRDGSVTHGSPARTPLRPPSRDLAVAYTKLLRDRDVGKVLDAYATGIKLPAAHATTPRPTTPRGNYSRAAPPLPDAPLAQLVESVVDVVHLHAGGRRRYHGVNQIKKYIALLMGRLKTPSNMVVTSVAPLAPYSVRLTWECPASGYRRVEDTMYFCPATQRIVSHTSEVDWARPQRHVRVARDTGGVAPPEPFSGDARLWGRPLTPKRAEEQRREGAAASNPRSEVPASGAATRSALTLGSLDATPEIAPLCATVAQQQSVDLPHPASTAAASTEVSFDAAATHLKAAATPTDPSLPPAANVSFVASRPPQSFASSVGRNAGVAPLAPTPLMWETLPGTSQRLSLEGREAVPMPTMATLASDVPTGTRSREASSASQTAVDVRQQSQLQSQPLRRVPSRKGFSAGPMSFATIASEWPEAEMVPPPSPRTATAGTPASAGPLGTPRGYNPVNHVYGVKPTVSMHE